MNVQTVKDALKVDVAISTPMAEALQVWSAMYQNKSPWLNKEVKSMNLASAIASEIARSVTIEMNVQIEGSPRANYLASQFERVIREMRNKVELGCALGGLMMKPYPNGKNVDVDFIPADQFFPVSFDSDGNIISCIFADLRTIGKNYYTRLEYHSLTSGGYTIKNIAYKSSSQNVLGQPISLTEVPEWANLAPEATIKAIDKPLFAYFKYPMANNVDTSSPLGVSCYSRAVGLIEQADQQWSGLLWEFESGQRAIHVDQTMFSKDPKTGEWRLPKKRLYRVLNQSSQVGEGETFHEWTPEFREASILSGLDAMLKKIEFNAGLAYGTISDPQSVEKTATEIKVSKQRFYATVTDTQKALRVAIGQLLWVMDTYTTLYKLAPAGKFQAGYEFDDSVVADHDTQFMEDSQAVGMYVMSKVEFRMRNYGETEEVARKKIEMVNAEMQPTSFFEEENETA